MRRTLTPTELCTIGNALATAGDAYAALAADCDKHNAPQLAEQFRRQRADARRFAELFTDADSAVIELDSDAATACAACGRQDDDPPCACHQDAERPPCYDDGPQDTRDL